MAVLLPTFLSSGAVAYALLSKLPSETDGDVPVELENINASPGASIELRLLICSDSLGD